MFQGFRVQGFGVQGSGFRVQGSGFRVQGSGFRVQGSGGINTGIFDGGRTMGDYFRVEDLAVYQKLCDLHIEIDNLTRKWPPEERFELSSQIRRCSNSSPANLAEKHSDRHVKNK